MLKKVFLNIEKKLGKTFLPLILVLFGLILFLVMFSSVQQKTIDFTEGQVAEESIRANKTIENTGETERKRKLAEEAVSPEYNYQDELLSEQHDRIDQLFNLIITTNQEIDAAYKKKVADAKKDTNVPTPTTEERIAALKKKFEQLDQEDVTFYQKLTDQFYQTVFALTTEEVEGTQTLALTLVDEQMAKRVRENDLQEFKDEAIEKLQYSDTNSNQQQAIRYIISLGIVVNESLDEKKTEEMKQVARNEVQPVMIYQGEVIVREGSQISAEALEKLELLGMTNQSPSVFPIVSMIVFIGIQLLMLLYFIRQFQETSMRIRFLLFYSATMLLSVSLMRFVQLFQSEQMSYVALLFPAAFTPLVLTQFVNRRAGIMSALFQGISTIFVFYSAIGTNALTIVLVTYLFNGLLATILNRRRLSEQGGPAVCWIILFPVLMQITLVVYQGLGISDGATWRNLICGLAGCLLSFLLSMGLHPYIELLVTDESVIVLNELSNPNHPLLKQLLEEAPGTYHHSMMVANLSANAVAEIGGRSLLTRVACYYHDIGKIKHANFFVENLPAGAENPHNFLLPDDSKKIIFGHVIDGAKILEDYGMPQMVIDVCYQHHGTTLMKYFYVKAKERDPKVTEAEYRYPGPKPQSREAAIVSIADSCEAAVRAMDHPSNDKIQDFVHQLIASRITDGQLDESGLTLGEIRKVERSLVNGLSSTFHSRIKYPKMKSEAEQMKEEQERREV